MSERKKKPSSVRHTRAIQRDRSKRPTVAPPDEALVEDLTELIHPAIYAEVAAYQDMGLRHRILTLPVMVAFILSLIWRQIGSVSEAVRVLKREGVLAEVRNRPQGSLSIEMVYRGLYHFTQAYHRGEATDPVAYLAHGAKDLGILKRKPRSSPGDLLNLTSAPSP